MQKMIIAIVAILIFLLAIGAFAISYHNSAISLENQHSAVQKDNKQQYANMINKIMQSAQVTKGQAEAIRDVVVEHAKNAGREGGGLMKMVTESIPNIPSDTWSNLQNIIVSSRDGFANRQTKLLDIEREHNNLRQKFPSSLICGGRPLLESQIVTSTRSEKAFETGVDDNLDLNLNDKPKNVEQ